MRRTILISFSLLYNLSAVGVSAETIYAAVGEYKVTSADISYSLGYLPSDAAELKEAVEDMVERYAVLTLAERKGYTVDSKEIDRALALTTKTRGGNTVTPSSTHREYVRQELVISKFIDGHIYPGVEVSDESLLTLFLLNPYIYMKYPPQDKTALKQVFPKYRNAVLNTYVTLQTGRLLAEAIDAARGELDTRYYR